MKNRLIITMGFLGFSSGLPYMLIFSTLATWLAFIKVDIGTVGFFAWISLTYSLKFLLAPFVDKFSIPILGRLGKRKGWILFTQILIIIFLVLISLTNPKLNLLVFAIFAFCIALFGAIQDIAIDAFRIESANLKDQGNLAASYQFGYRVAILVSTTGALLLAARTDWTTTYQFMGALMLFGVLGLVLSKEKNQLFFERQTLLDSFWLPLKDFYSRFGLYIASFLLLIIATYRLTDLITGQITNPFYVQKGYSLDEIALVVKTVAIAASIFGFFVGGFLIKRMKITSCLLIGGFLVFVTNIFFAYIAASQNSLINLSIVVGMDSMAAGIVGTVNITFLTSLVSKKFVAFQYALLTSFMALPGKLLAGFSGLIVMSLKNIFGLDYGWMFFYLITSLFTIPSIIFLLIFIRKYESKYF